MPVSKLNGYYCVLKKFENCNRKASGFLFILVCFIDSFFLNSICFMLQNTAEVVTGCNKG